MFASFFPPLGDTTGYRLCFFPSGNHVADTIGSPFLLVPAIIRSRLPHFIFFPHIEHGRRAFRSRSAQGAQMTRPLPSDFLRTLGHRRRVSFLFFSYPKRSGARFCPLLFSGATRRSGPSPFFANGSQGSGRSTFPRLLFFFPPPNGREPPVLIPFFFIIFMAHLILTFPSRRRLNRGRVLNPSSSFPARPRD